MKILNKIINTLLLIAIITWVSWITVSVQALEKAYNNISCEKVAGGY